MRQALACGALTLMVLAGCGGNSGGAPAKQPSAVAARLATPQNTHHGANDSAVWIDPDDARNSIMLLAHGEGGLELADLSGARLSRLATLETNFVEVRQGAVIGGAAMDLVIVSDQRLGAVRVYALNRAENTVQEVTAAPLAIDDSITGLCTYASALTGKLYAFVATDRGQLEQWEFFAGDARVGGRLIRRIPAGKGAAHCVGDDSSGHVYFGEESVGIWRVAAEPESDAARVPVDLMAPRGSLHEEVKGLAVHRSAEGTAFLIAADAGAGVFNVYALAGDSPADLKASFKVSGNDLEMGDAEGITVVAAPLGPQFPRGVVIIADEDAGDYKLLSLGDVIAALGLPAPTAATPLPRQPAARTVKPVVETEPVASFGDAADDPAIWVDPTDPSRTVVIGTDKKLGLNVYDLEGKRLQTVPDGRMNNVDLRNGFALAGKSITIVAATNRTHRAIGLYRFDGATRQLSSIADGMLESGLGDPYGLCMYHSAKTGLFYVLANDSIDGKLLQWKLVEKHGKVGIEKVRELAVGSQNEGCVADDELGHLYVAEEDVALWKYSAEPDGGAERTAVGKADDGVLTADIEGVSIYYGANGGGYLIASNQGEDNYAIYRREGNNEFLGKVHVIANEALGIDGTAETDGLDIVSAPLGTQFPAGLLVVQDGRNLVPAARQNFKFVSWQDVLDSLQRH